MVISHPVHRCIIYGIHHWLKEDRRVFAYARIYGYTSVDNAKRQTASQTLWIPMRRYGKHRANMTSLKWYGAVEDMKMANRCLTKKYFVHSDNYAVRSFILTTPHPQHPPCPGILTDTLTVLDVCCSCNLFILENTSTPQKGAHFEEMSSNESI